MKPGDRIVIVGGPWPERRGCHGTVTRAGAATLRIELDDDPNGQDDIVIDPDDVKLWRLAEHIQPPA